MNTKLIKRIIFYIFIIIVWYFFIEKIYTNYDAIKNYEFNINIYYIALSIVLQLVFIFYKGFIWSELIKWHKIKTKDIFFIHSLTWLIRYVPGKATYIFSRILLLGKYNVSKKQWFVSIIYENVLQIVSSFMVWLPIIIFYFVWWLSNYEIFTGVILSIIFMFIISKPVFNYFINLWLVIFKKDKLPEEYLLNPKEIAKSLFLFIIWTIIYWLSFFFMIKGISDIDFTLVIPMIWAWTIAFVIWLVAIFSPNGIWVREWVLVFLLQFYFPLEISIVISIFSRLWSTIWDWLSYIYALVYKIYFKD